MHSESKNEQLGKKETTNIEYKLSSAMLHQSPYLTHVTNDRSEILI